MNLVACGTDHFELLVSLVTHLNQDAVHHIGYFGIGEAEVRAALDECLIPPADGFLLAYDGDTLAGVLGVDADPEIGRAWLYGPIIRHARWHEIADELYRGVQPLIPAGIREHELFCDAKNLNVRKFAGTHGFVLRSENAIYSLMRNDFIRSANDLSTVMIYKEAYFTQFAHLHQELFPNTYLTAKQIVERRDGGHRLLIAVEGDRLLGYHFCKIETESGYVDFIGVDPKARRRGLGAALLVSGLDWMFAAPTTLKVSLTVNANNQAARKLYDDFGFKSERLTRGYRRMLPGPAL